MEKVTVNELLSIDLKGKIVCFPTDTVYGVGAIYNDLEAINKIYLMKKRDYSKPLAILTNTKDIDQYIKYKSKKALELINNGWPGALTLIFEKSEVIDDIITSGKNTIAFRMPNSKIALAILDKFGLMATTSVNLSGEKPLNDINEIEKLFSDYIDYLVIDKETVNGKPSRIIDVTKDKEVIIR